MAKSYKLLREKMSDERRTKNDNNVQEILAHMDLQELRLRLLKPVEGELPEAVVKAMDAYDKAWDARDKAGAAYVKAMDAYSKAMDAYDKAGAACDKALSDHADEINALHAAECPDCPWNGHTIFPKDNNND